MKVGFIGAGNVTRTIGRHLINTGHTVVVSNSRGRKRWADSSLNWVRAPARGPNNSQPSAI
jgi:3-hydroxyisobutyrate dehydrogenase-like beta-hydroxyacid dehydrogenase